MRILLIDDELVALNVLKKRIDWVQFGFSEVLTAQDTEQDQTDFGQRPCRSGVE